jgi:hypothetical protein
MRNWIKFAWNWYVVGTWAQLKPKKHADPPASD